MSMNILPTFSGVSLALMAASLAGFASTSAGASEASMKPAADSVKLVHCAGVNSCKGHNDCKTAKNACKGQVSCKGQGFVSVPAAACANLGGKVTKAKIGKAVASSSFVHCMGVNSCKGHNDCKTATNACKGQGSCKGQGFIALPAPACANLGGTTG